MTAPVPAFLAGAYCTWCDGGISGQIVALETVNGTVVGETPERFGFAEYSPTSPFVHRLVETL
jgi:hypothetical protein